MNSPWEIQLKGSWARGYELSVIRANNEHGHLSYGWGGLDKIILFSDGTGGNHNGNRDPEFCMRCAKILCDGLNQTGQ